MQITQFKNEPLLDFSDPEVRKRVGAALADAKAVLRESLMFTPVIDGRHVYTSQFFYARNPSDASEVLGLVHLASVEIAEQAVQVALKALSRWRAKTPEERGLVLMKAAEIMSARREFFIALMMLEVGKNRHEADGEAAEAIDMLRWYGIYAPYLARFGNETLVQPKGEKNTLALEPLGIGVSIQPWNFPLAISVGPTAAGLVMGNAMIYKPSKQSSMIGFYIVNCLHEAGIPPGVLAYLPGNGAEIGNYLVAHPRVSFVTFTGSTEVAANIERIVAQFNTEEIYKLPPAERRRKRIAALETGGKGAIIVDSDADLDEAVVGVAESAFSFQGQKCSACTRVIVHKDVFQSFMRRLAERIKSTPIGSPEDARNVLGPVIDKSAHKRIMDTAEKGRDEGIVLAAGTLDPAIEGKGYFVAPLVLGSIPAESPLAQEEIFGPILLAFSFSDFEEAIALANGTSYGLTLGIYSRNPKHIALAGERLDAGNIYINRKITGAVVGRQPFGGRKMSGDGTKAGGWDYLLRFTQQKCVSENTARRGYALDT